MTGMPFSAKIRAVWMPGRQSTPMITAGGRWLCACFAPDVVVSFVVLIEVKNLGESDQQTWDKWEPPACCWMRRNMVKQATGRADISTLRLQAQRHSASGRSP